MVKCIELERQLEEARSASKRHIQLEVLRFDCEQKDKLLHDLRQQLRDEVSLLPLTKMLK